MADQKKHIKEIMDRLLDHVMVSDPLEDIKLRARKFVAERDWQQFNSPKNLSMALIAEAGELVEHFQWITEEKSRNLNRAQLKEVGYELADIFIYLTRLADELNIDLLKVTNEKMRINCDKYPV